MRPVLVVLLPLFTAFNTAQANDQVLFDYYCHDQNISFKESVIIGEGQKVAVNHGGYMLEIKEHAIDPSIKFIRENIIAAGGVDPTCAEFFISKGVGQYTENGLLARVHFAFDSSELTNQSRYILDQILSNINHDGRLEVEGHTDSSGTEGYNFSLGMKRSESVAEYMQQYGMLVSHIDTVSKGESEAIADNATEAGRYLNRRVDIKQ